MNKRGLSTVVTTLIIILLVLVAIGIVWAVVKNVLQTGTDQLSLGQFTIDLEIKNVQVSGDDFSIEVKRNPGVGNLVGIKFILSDGESTHTEIIKQPLEELGTKNFEVPIGDLIFVEEISIAPIIKTESDKESIGNVVEEYKLNKEDKIEMIKNMEGLVSWWRFEENANDEVGDNDGTISGATYTSNGQYGGAYEFNGIDNNIVVADNPSLQYGGGEFTFSALIYSHTTSNQNVIIGNSKWMGIDGSEGIKIMGTYYNQKRLKLELKEELNYENLFTPRNTILANTWYQITVTRKSDGHVLAYLDGALQATSDNAYTNLDNENGFTIGSTHLGGNGAYWNGTIDEVMIFNKTLSENEVKALYKLDFS